MFLYIYIFLFLSPNGHNTPCSWLVWKFYNIQSSKKSVDEHQTEIVQIQFKGILNKDKEVCWLLSWVIFFIWSARWKRWGTWHTTKTYKYIFIVWLSLLCSHLSLNFSPYPVSSRTGAHTHTRTEPLVNVSVSHVTSPFPLLHVTLVPSLFW